MANDTKAKLSPVSPIQRIINEMLFIKQFHHVSDLSPEDVRAQLEDMAYQPDKMKRVFFPRQRIVNISPIRDQQQQFTIRTKVGGLYTELTASGYITYDPATRKTTVIGQVKFDPVYLAVLVIGLFFLITWGLASLSRTGMLASPFVLVTLTLTNLFYFRQMFLDRNTLLNTLQESLSIRDVSKSHQRLADHSASEHNQQHLSQQHTQQSQETS